jgi:hypothetical protein
MRVGYSKKVLGGAVTRNLIELDFGSPFGVDSSAV